MQEREESKGDRPAPCRWARNARLPLLTGRVESISISQWAFRKTRLALAYLGLSHEVSAERSTRWLLAIDLVLTVDIFLT